MFYKKRREIRDVGDWIVLELAPDVLWEFDCLFFPTNAANATFRDPRDNALRGRAALETLFEGERPPELPPCAPTGPQADVIVSGQLPRRWIGCVFVNNRSEHEKEREGFRLVYEPHMFQPRCDA